MENNQLSKDFVFELIKLCLIDDKSLSICQTYLKYQYLPLAPQKKIFKYILDGYAISGKAPTIGMIQQTYHTDLEVTNILSRVKKLVIEKDHYDEILVTFEVFIKDSRFRILYDRIGDLYNEGKMDDAIKLLADESKAINEFQIKSTLYTTVFSGFAQRNEKRQKEGDSILLEKLTYGIHGLDDPTRGGMNKGTSTLILARSGVGKSTFLRWIGLCNARLGRRVVHFQAEGTEAECLEAYDAGWTSIALHDIEFGNIPDGKKDKILKAQRNIVAGGGEIYVYASESFDTMSIEACRDILIDIESIHGKVDLVLYDYLEIFTVKGQYGNSEAGERKRREEVANKMTNTAVEFKCAVVTATQANDIAPEKYNSEDFVMTRTHISEFKGCVKPFSNFLTLNQTDDEYDAEVIRIWVDKFRKHKKPAKPITHYQSRKNGRYYDSKRTLETFYTPLT